MVMLVFTGFTFPGIYPERGMSMGNWSSTMFVGYGPWDARLSDCCNVGKMKIWSRFVIAFIGTFAYASIWYMHIFFLYMRYFNIYIYTNCVFNDVCIVFALKTLFFSAQTKCVFCFFLLNPLTSQLLRGFLELSDLACIDSIDAEFYGMSFLVHSGKLT